MKTSDFNFDLPDDLIARYPLTNRTESRLLCLNDSNIKHHIFSDLPALLNSNDVLIFNDTRVMPARLFAKKKTGGKVEILIERILSATTAVAHLKSNKSWRIPCTLSLENGVEVEVAERQGDLFMLRFHLEGSISLPVLLEAIGNIPLPGYMGRLPDTMDTQRYQTVYARELGAVAAPTAGLHFDRSLLDILNQQGVKSGFITLHVGAGTFKPVLVEDITQHTMHHEIFEIQQPVCDLINEARARGGRIIAVGTTTVRTLETAFQGQDILKPGAGETNIFIYPGYRFRCIDALITNFHLPKSTLLMLVCALGGYESVMRSYEAAIAEKYRFYSYGDAMFLPNLSNQNEI